MMLATDVNEDLLKRFRRFVVGKHGKLHGSLKPEIEEALRNHLNEQEGGSVE